MATNSPTIDYRDDYYRGAAKLYFDRILDTVIEMGGLREVEGPILDFGCGHGHLKRRVGRENVVGYDVIPELSEIEDYRQLVPARIVLVNVLEHIPVAGIRELLREFVRMNREADLVVALPTENLLSKIAMRLAGQPHAHDDHVSSYREVNEAIEAHYLPLRRRYVFLRMEQVTLYRIRKDGKSDAP